MSVVFDPQFQQGLQFLQAGQFARAEFALGHALVRHPGQPLVLAALADLNYQTLRMAAAAAYAGKAVTALSADASLEEILYVSKVLRCVGEDETAMVLPRRYTARHDLNQSEIVALAVHFLNLDLIEDSLQLFKQADPEQLEDYGAAMAGIARLYSGDIASATECFRYAVRKNPGNAEAAIQLAMLRVPDGRAERISAWESICHAHIPDASRSLLQFALFNEYDADGDIVNAFRALSSANALRLDRQPYDSDLETALVDDYLAQLAGIDFPNNADFNNVRPAPVFIVGLPRTGTTLLEKSLTALTDLQAVGEHLNFRKSVERQLDRVFTSPFEIADRDFAHRLDFTALGRRYLGKTAWRADGRAFYTDKEPFNFAYAGLIAKAMPEARIIHIRRNPMDACFSAYKQSFAVGGFPASYSLESLAAYYRNYARVMAFWREALGERMLEIRYEDLVLRHEETQACIRAYCRFGDAPADAAPRPFRASTLSAAQVQKPIHAGNINAWAKYAEHLQPLRQALDTEYTAYMGEVEGAEVL